MEKLKPCPFCGSKAKICGHRTFRNAHDYYNIECTNQKCGVIMLTDLNAHDAINAWNRRVNDGKA